MYKRKSGILKNEPESKQQREIAESLKYASYIQQALLPDSAEISRFLPDHFLFYQTTQYGQRRFLLHFMSK